MRGPTERYRPIRAMALRYAHQWPDAAEWWICRALIPDSWFTKRGPGVFYEARKAWNRFTKEQKSVAVARGFFPAGGPTR